MNIHQSATSFSILEELGAAFFPTEAWGQPLTFDLSTGGLHHPALLHTALHGPHMVSFSSSNFTWIKQEHRLEDQH